MKRKTEEQLQTELEAQDVAFQKALDRGLWAGDFRDAERLLQHAGDGLPRNLEPRLEEMLFYFAKDGGHDLEYYKHISSGTHLRTLPVREVVVGGKKGKLYDTQAKLAEGRPTGELWCVVAFADGTVNHNVIVKTLDELVNGESCAK